MKCQQLLPSPQVETLPIRHRILDALGTDANRRDRLREGGMQLARA